MEDQLLNEYRAARDYLYGFIDYERGSAWKYDGRHFDLARLRSLLAALGNPHSHGPFIHVAGTNGKGTVAAMTARALTLAGLRTGLYTSPHLVTFRERIRVDGALIPREAVVEHVRRLRAAVGNEPGLTFFDVWTALAFDRFASVETDAAVIEVGMGGRLDSTNVVTPVVSVITPVSLEHVGKLGNTIAEIAAEKAGIIKQGVPVVIGPQHPDALQVILAAAKEKDARAMLAGRDFTWSAAGDGIDYRGLSWALDAVKVLLPGAFQRENAATALAALETAADAGLAITPEYAREGIETVRWPGRLQQIGESPAVVVDGACNPAATAVVRDYVRSRTGRDNVVAVIGMCDDKQAGEVLSILGEAVGRLICTRAGNPRELPPDELALHAPDNVSVTVEPDSLKALERAEQDAGPDGLVVVTGSLYLAGTVIGERARESIEQI